MRILDWSTLDPAHRAAALARPARRDAADVEGTVRGIIAAVRERGDAAVRELGERFDGVRIEELAVTESEFTAAARALGPEDIAAIDRAIATVRAFHEAQGSPPLRIETAPGVICERRSVPVRAVGLYVPAGSAPLPSTAIMLAVPAALARCPMRILCTPPRPDGHADAAVLIAARRAGIERVFKAGGAQAIAAMAYGTAAIPKCDKLFGPGNAWVTAAKMQVAQDPEGAAADLPAGVSEVLVIADETARADFVAADLLAQAEHGADAQALLVTPSPDLAARVAQAIEQQRTRLARTAILERSIGHIRLIVAADLDAALDIANAYAPEHLLLEVGEPRRWLGRVECAGAVFLGHWSPETVGDYCSGPNHTLPTYGYARAHSGLGLEDFQKRITVQELSPAGLAGLGATAETLARLEGLDAHAAAVSIRLAALAERAA